MSDTSPNSPWQVLSFLMCWWGNWGPERLNYWLKMIANTQGGLGSWWQLHVKCRVSAVPGVLQAFPWWILIVISLLPSFVDETSELQEGKQCCLLSKPGLETCVLSTSPCCVIPLLGTWGPLQVSRLTSRRWSERKLARADLAWVPRPMSKTVFPYLSSPLANFEHTLCTVHRRGIQNNAFNACAKQDVYLSTMRRQKAEPGSFKSISETRSWWLMEIYLTTSSLLFKHFSTWYLNLCTWKTFFS